MKISGVALATNGELVNCNIIHSDTRLNAITKINVL